MNIGYLGSRIDMISGHSRPVLEMASRLRERGHRVRVVSTALSPSRARYHQEVAPVEEIPIERPYRSLIEPLRDPRAIWDLIEWSDVLHELSPYARLC